MTDIYKDKETIDLAKAVMSSGVEIGSLTMREPTVADQMASDAMKGSQAQNEVTLFANLCDVSPDTIKSLTLRDYKKLQAVYTDFIG